MAFATNSDLIDLNPGFMDHGVDDWTNELNKAESDIKTKIRGEWFNKRYSGDDWDPTLLTESQWTLATLYRALAHYILPQLSSWRTDGDSFREQISFYQANFAEEINLQFTLGVEYDYDEDGIVQDSEKNRVQQDRIWR
jgi:hypothetical protein